MVLLGISMVFHGASVCSQVLGELRICLLFFIAFVLDRLYDEGDVALLVKQAERVPVRRPSHIHHANAQSVRTPPQEKQTERSTTPSNVPEAPLPLSANLTINKAHHKK